MNGVGSWDDVGRVLKGCWEFRGCYEGERWCLKGVGR